MKRTQQWFSRRFGQSFLLLFIYFYILFFISSISVDYELKIAGTKRKKVGDIKTGPNDGRPSFGPKYVSFPFQSCISILTSVFRFIFRIE